MKAQSEATIQFSGYPLHIADIKQNLSKAELSLAKPLAFYHTTFIQQNPISNDPGNWDDGWFNGYE